MFTDITCLGCLLSAIVEPYVLRLRHIIAGNYLPGREAKRAAWLYQDILMKRQGHFLTFLKQKIGFSRPPDEYNRMTCLTLLARK